MPGMGPGDAGGASQPGQSGENAEDQQAFSGLVDPQESDSSTAGSREGDADSAEARDNFDRAWEASLPPAIRNAMKTRESMELPAGYEEKLRRYFENLD